MIDLQTIFLFKDLPTDELAMLIKSCKELNYKSGETIVKRATSPNVIVYIVDGIVKMVEDSDKRMNRIIYISKNNEFIDVYSIFSGLPYHFSAIALTNCRVILFDTSVIKEIAKKNQKFNAVLLRYLSILSIYLLRNTIDLFRKNLKGRLAYLILYFAHDVFQNLSFMLPLSRNDMAEFCGVSRENISRALQEFHHEGIISLKGKDLHILNESLLEKISDLG